MTIIESINKLDSLKHNTYSHGNKVEWLSRLDAMVKTEIIDTHEGGEDVVFNGYNDETSLDTVLLVPAPYDEVYLRWLEAQVDYYNDEIKRYNNSMDLFHAALGRFRNYYNRTHMPKGKKFKFF